MKKTFKQSIYFVSAFFLLAFYFSLPSFAQGDTICSGSISGTTGTSNVNGGQTYFDIHPGQQNGVVYDFNAGVGGNDVLSILGVPSSNGQFAPGSVGDAACVNANAGVITHQGVQRNYEYELRGWAWNDNIGFISFHCQNGVNNSGISDPANPSAGGVACGSIDYGVYVSPDLGGGNREVFGYAWSPTLGWIQFDTQVQSGGNQSIDMDSAGDLTGAAWTEAGVWMDFSGINLNLAEADNPTPPTTVNPTPNWCDCRPYLCVQIEPTPASLVFGDTGGGDFRLADGTEGYYVHLYLRDANGVDPLDTAAYNFDTGSISLEWTDTVKFDQVNSNVTAPSSLATNRSPFDSGLGAVTFKPLDFSDFAPVPGDPGHYISLQPVSSAAPTSGANLSFTTSTEPPFTVRNDVFINDIGITGLEPNELVLERVVFDPIVAPTSGTALDPDACTLSVNFAANDTVLRGPIYPNGRVNMPIEFRPAIELDTLYSGVDEDKIQAYRSVPVTATVAARAMGSLPSSVLSGANIDLNLAYSPSLTQAQPSCVGESNPAASNFDFSFVSNGSNRLTYALDQLSSPTPLQLLATLPQYNGLSTEEQASVLPCDFAEAPSLYSVISYAIKGQNISYFSNKLPRLGGGRIANPEIVVHGNIYGQSASNVSSTTPIQSAGDVSVSVVKDTINENLEKYLGDVTVNAGTNCTITALTTSMGGNCSSSLYDSFTVGTGAAQERVLYFRGTDVRINLASGTWTNNWVIVADEGNIYIENDIYNGANPSNRLSLLAFRGEGANFYPTGNVYIAPCDSAGVGVKNIQATIIADGTVFSYDGDIANVESTTGEPIWSDYNSMVSGLSCQLLIEGAIYSDNTIGGADLDTGTNPKQYLLLGGGRVLSLPLNQQERMQAQQYDLNYLRLFRLDLQLNRQGLPIDQKCGRALTSQDILDINSGATLCGDRRPCDPNGSQNQLFACDGINPLKAYSGDGDDGDLVTPQDAAVLAQGLDNAPTTGTEFDPVYVFYRQPNRNSFLFSKPGSLTTSGN